MVECKLWLVVAIGARVEGGIVVISSIQIPPILIPTMGLIPQGVEIIEAIDGQLTAALAVGLWSPNSGENQPVSTEIFSCRQEITPSIDERGIYIGIARSATTHSAHSPTAR